MTEEDRISTVILEAALEVHRGLGGPGLLESVYEEALVYELEERGLRVERQVLCPIRYKGHLIGQPLRLDLLVEGIVIVECKATASPSPVFEAQLLTYLRVSGHRLGLLLNFGLPLLKNGIQRIVNGLH